MPIYASLMQLAAIWAALVSGGTFARAPLHDVCLPEGEAALAGVHLDALEAQVLKRLGEPARRESGIATQDAGEHSKTHLIYPNLQVDLGPDGRVERLITSSPAVRTPTGIRVGQTVAQVTARLGASDDLDELEEVTWEVLVCHDGPLDFTTSPPAVTFTWAPDTGPFDPRYPLAQVRRVAKIEMTQ